MTNPEIDKFGTKCWYNEMEQLHREDGPAIEWTHGTKHWCQNGKLHRLDGPAITWTNGSKYWYQHGKLHRTDGPAYIDGPAYVSCPGVEEWYVNGKLIDIKPILERLDISPDWKSWTDAEKMIVRLALP